MCTYPQFHMLQQPWKDHPNPSGQFWCDCPGPVGLATPERHADCTHAKNKNSSYHM